MRTQLLIFEFVLASKLTRFFRRPSTQSWWKSSSSGDNAELSFDFRKITKLQHVLNSKIDFWAHHDSPTHIKNEACNAMQSIADKSQRSHRENERGKCESCLQIPGNYHRLRSQVFRGAYLWQIRNIRSPVSVIAERARQSVNWW